MKTTTTLTILLLSYLSVSAQSPGSISTNLTLWFKADANVYSDAGVTAATNSGTVQQWNEQSSNASIPNASQTTASNQPTLNTNVFNYNPAILFDGVNDFLASSNVQFSTFTSGTNISMYGVMQHLSGAGTNFTWDDAGSNAKIVLSPGSSYFDKNGSNRATTGVGGGNTQQHLASTIANGTNLKVYDAGAYKNNSTVTSPSGTSSSPIAFGKMYAHGWPGSVLFGEIAIYNAAHGTTEKVNIETYFAIKYGITLSNALGGVDGDYIASLATQIWDADDYSDYHNNIIGIGKDNDRTLLQKQSHTIDDTTRIYLSTLAATNSANAGAFASDISYVVVGDNQGRMCGNATINAEVPSACGLYSRLEREWKVTKTNLSEDFSMDFTLNACAKPTAVTISHLRLLVDDDGDFSSGTTTCYFNGDAFGTVISYSGSVITVSGISDTHIANNSTRFITIGSTNSITPLPIELLSFEATCNNETPTLNWTTANEINNDYFTILRSEDGLDFSPIGTVKGNGNSNSIVNYTWTDNNPLKSKAYYQLKQTDYNGEFKLLGIRVITCDQANNITIYPNPFKNSFTVQLSAQVTSPITLEVYDYLGRVVYTQLIDTSNTAIVLNEQLPTGTYILKMYNESIQVIERLVKTK